MPAKVACFPNIENYGIPVNILIEKTLGYRTMDCPVTTKKTAERGSKNSPDTICTPFKIMLGNFMDALDNGANVLVMPAIGCRLGFYDPLLKQILTDLGYKFEIINLFEYAMSPNERKVFQVLNEINPDLSEETFMQAVRLAAKVVRDMDELGEFLRKNIAFQTQKGRFEDTYRRYLGEVRKVQTVEEADAIKERYLRQLQSIEIDKPEQPLRVGIIGDLYSVMEPHGNCYLEKWLAQNRVEIVRPLDMTYLYYNMFDMVGQVEDSGGYTNYYIGGNAGNTVVLANQMAQGEVDGLIHVKAATCSPEITAMQILQNISADHDIPIIYLTFDTETSEAGLHTRLEAFLDMLSRKEKRRCKKHI